MTETDEAVMKILDAEAAASDHEGEEYADCE